MEIVGGELVGGAYSIEATLPHNDFVQESPDAPDVNLVVVML